MTPKPHHALDYARGLARVKQCLSVCYFAPVLTGTIYSKRFKPEDIVTYNYIDVKLPDDMVFFSNIKITRP